MAKKKMSFMMLLGLVVGGIVVIMGATLWVSVSMSKKGKATTVVTRRIEQPVQTPLVQTPAVDIAAVQLASSQQREADSVQARELALAQVRVMQDAVTKTNELMATRLDQLNTSIQALDQRISSIEQRRPTVEIVKPARSTRAPVPTADPKVRYQSLPTGSGTTVRAVVGKRAWVESGTTSDSFAPGDVLPGSVPLRIMDIKRDSGIMIVTPIAGKG